MTCKACADAATTPRCDMFEARCEGCDARAVAALGLHLESQSTEPPQMTVDYRRVLKQMFGERAREGHQKVLEWAARIRAQDKKGETMKPENHRSKKAVS